jgi:hypothetical protein
MIKSTCNNTGIAGSAQLSCVLSGSRQSLTAEETAFLAEFQNGISKSRRTRPDRKRPPARHLKLVLLQVERVVIFRLSPLGNGSRKKRAGYELAILNRATGKQEKTWFYNVAEEYWARAGLKTLLDAQTRQILDERSKWKHYDAVSWHPSGQSFESLARSGAFTPPVPRIRSWTEYGARFKKWEGGIMSSKRSLRRRGCEGKVRHETITDAYAAQSGHARTFGETLGVYWCTFCRGWHLGHTQQKRTRSNFKEAF